MFSIPNLKRFGLATLQALVVTGVLAASVVSLCDANCRERTQDLTLDGVCVGLLIALMRLLHILRRPKRVTEPLFSWWCVARVLFGVELRYGLVGGYLLGVTRAVIECLM